MLLHIDIELTEREAMLIQDNCPQRLLNSAKVAAQAALKLGVGDTADGECASAVVIEIDDLAPMINNLWITVRNEIFRYNTNHTTKGRK